METIDTHVHQRAVPEGPSGVDDYIQRYRFALHGDQLVKPFELDVLHGKTALFAFGNGEPFGVDGHVGAGGDVQQCGIVLGKHIAFCQ